MPEQEYGIDEFLYERFIEKFREWNDRKWHFDGKYYYGAGIVKFHFRYRDKVTDEKIVIEGAADTDISSFEIIKAVIYLDVVEADKLFSLSIDVDEDNDYLLERLNEDVQDRLFSCKMYGYFRDDFNRYTKEGPFEYLKKLISEGDLELSKTEELDCGDGIVCFYEGNFGEDEIKLIIDDSENYIEEDDEDWEPTEYVGDTLEVDVSGVFSLFYSKENCDAIREIINKTKRSVVGFEDFLVRTTLFQCINKSHHLYKVDAIVYIDNGVMISEYKAKAFHCLECDEYFITDPEYYKLKNIGRICCKVITIDEYRDIQEVGYSSWAKKSLLRCYGYTVNATDNLSEEERRRILHFVIDNEIMSRLRVIDFLTWLLGKTSAPNMKKARQKWQDDIDYLNEYYISEETVIVKSFTQKNRMQRQNNYYDGIDEELPFG